MLMQRIMGVFTFKRQVYADVEKDTSFTTTAWAIVAIGALLGALGSYASNTSAGITTPLLGAVLSVVGFAVGVFVIAWVGKALFKADVTFDQMVRTLGLANVWQFLGVIALVGFISPTLLCVVSPILLIMGLLSLASWFIAAKEALDLDWVQTIVTVVIGYVVILVITTVVGGIIGIGAGIGGALLGG